MSIVLSSCSNENEPSSQDISLNIQQYKWVCRTSDEPLVDDDYQWAIFDDYVITLYFVSNYECVINYFRKHFDTDDGTSYERDAQTVKYTIQGNNIVLDNSNYTETEFTYGDDFLSSKNFVYEKEEISSSDRDWINKNFKHIELEPDESTSEAFKGLKEIYADSWGGVAFGNPHCDNMGRLTYYKAMYYRNQRYDYSENTIISKSGYTDYDKVNTYTLNNGLITSFVSQLFDGERLKLTSYYTIKYDNNRRIIQIVSDDGKNSRYSKTFYNFKWNSQGDIIESNTIYYNEESTPSYIYKFDYLSSTAQIPSMIMGGNQLWCAFNITIDPILVMEGFFGNSNPRHILKSRYAEMVSITPKPYERYNWIYSFDSKGRITKLTQEYEDLYDNGKDDEKQIYTFKWN